MLELFHANSTVYSLIFWWEKLNTCLSSLVQIIIQNIRSETHFKTYFLFLLGMVQYPFFFVNTSEPVKKVSPLQHIKVSTLFLFVFF